VFKGLTYDYSKHLNSYQLQLSLKKRRYSSDTEVECHKFYREY